jgi:hypothetical protein
LTEQAIDGPFTFCFFCTLPIISPRPYMLHDHTSRQTIGCVCSTCAREQPEHLQVAVAAKIHQAYAHADLLRARTAPVNTYAHASTNLFMAQAERVNSYAHDLECLLCSLDMALISGRR